MLHPLVCLALLLFFSNQPEGQLGIFLSGWIGSDLCRFHPFIGHKGPYGEYRYSSTLFLASALEGGEGSASRPGRTLPSGKSRYPLYRRLGGPQGRSGQVRKISPPTGIRFPDRPARRQFSSDLNIWTPSVRFFVFTTCSDRSILLSSSRKHKYMNGKACYIGDQLLWKGGLFYGIFLYLCICILCLMIVEWKDRNVL